MAYYQFTNDGSGGSITRQFFRGKLFLKGKPVIIHDREFVEDLKEKHPTWPWVQIGPQGIIAHN